MKRIRRDDSDEGNILRDLNKILFKISRTDDPRLKKVLQSRCSQTLMLGVKCGYSLRTMKNMILKFVEPDKVPAEYTDIIGKF